MRVACIGGGPGGLFFATLLKRSRPSAEVVVFERNRPDDTFGFGVVFSDATLHAIDAADPLLSDALTKHGRHWDRIEVRVHGARESVGGMGMAPSADIGDRHAVFQPCHGTAPDIMGQGKANPTAMILSAAMMLDWLADKHGHDGAAEAAQRIERAVDKAFAAGIRPLDLGGRSGTVDTAKGVLAAL